MASKVRIPAPLRKLAHDQPIVECQGRNVEEVLADLESKCPGLRARICDETGKVRGFVNVFVNGEDIRFQKGTQTPVAENADISIIPAIAGGLTDK